eukprot:3313668-Amphidinium_carterae.1
MSGSMNVDEARAPLKDRQGATTSVVSADSLFESNFQDFYKGSGVPERECAAHIAGAIVEFAEEMSIPLQLHVDGEGTLCYDDLPVEDRIAKVFAPVLVDGSYDNTHLAEYLFTCSSFSLPAGFLKLSCARHALHKSAETAAEILVTKFKLADPSSDGVARIYTSEVALRAADECSSNWSNQKGGRCIDMEAPMRKFYSALNEVLASDNRPRLQVVMPYIRGLTYFLNQTRHSGGTVYSGVCLSPNSCGRLRPGCRVRIPRFLSTTPLKQVAEDHVSDIGEHKG